MSHAYLDDDLEEGNVFVIHIDVDLGVGILDKALELQMQD